MVVRDEEAKITNIYCLSVCLLTVLFDALGFGFGFGMDCLPVACLLVSDLEEGVEWSGGVLNFFLAQR